MEQPALNEPTPAPKSLEELKEIFSQRLNNILYKELTVDNIESFANDALAQTVELTQDILVEYKNNPVLEGNLTLTNREQEDLACKTLGLPDIQEILQWITDKKEEISKLSTYLYAQVKRIDEIITPPNQNQKNLIANGEGEKFETKKLFPRLLTLMYILKNDTGIVSEDCFITEGAVTQKMMRQTPYVRVEIPDLNRLVYICDEEGNASYVFDTDVLAENGLTIEDVDLDSKDEKNSIISKYPASGVRFVQSRQWRNNVSYWLQNSLPKVVTEENSEIISETDEILKSEFKKEKKEFLSFEDFQNEVRAIYPYKENTNIIKWYNAEFKKHKNWPSSPMQVYEGKGWVSYRELVNPNERFLSFDELCKEINTLYKGEENIFVWYKKEYKKHSNWHSHPENKYKDEGWTTWPALAGIIHTRGGHDRFLVYDEYQKEVFDSYTGVGRGDVRAWYLEEYKKHPNWPSNPEHTYVDKGWIGFPQLVGKESRINKEYLSFEGFQNEVKSLHKGEGDIKKWYDVEYKKHKNWPANPNFTYKDKGWVGWPELVGKENPFKKEYLAFSDFQGETKIFYSGQKNIGRWYIQEYKKHKGWPSNPQQIYQDKGWVGWSDLIK